MRASSHVLDLADPRFATDRRAEAKQAPAALSSGLPALRAQMPTANPDYDAEKNQPPPGKGKAKGKK